jgi:hypothetical protein
MFHKATRKQALLRLALCGPAGSGKSYTGLRIATGLLGPGERLAVLDTEHGSAELYADEPNPDGGAFDFDTVRLDQLPGRFSAENYVKCLRSAAEAGYRVVLVDSLSHAWAGEGGVLDYVDNVAARGGRGGEGNKFSAWRQGTKAQNELVDALLSYPGHVICTLRTKVEYVLEQVNGRATIRKVGMASIQRDGVDYEFTVVGDLDVDTHRLIVTKSRCSTVADRTFLKAGADLARELRTWLDNGEAPPAEPPAAPATPPSEHHPSWPDARAAFCAELGRMDMTYDGVADVCATKGRPRPSAMPPEQRRALLTWLRTDEGRDTYRDRATQLAEEAARADA